MPHRSPGCIHPAFTFYLGERNGDHDYRLLWSRVIRLTAERLAHILDHPEMRGMEAELERVLREPELVRRSLTDPAVAIFYAFYARTSVGGKWLCIVVKYLQDDAFVVTAYLTDKPKTGEQLWPTK